MAGTALYLSKGDYQVLAADIVVTLAGSSVIVLINADESGVTDTIKAAATTEKSYVLAANTYAKIIVESEIELDFGSTSTNQTVEVDIYDGVTLEQSYNVQTLAANGHVVFTAKVSFVDTTGHTIAIKQHGLTGADLNTNITVKSLRVYGVL